MTPTLNQLGTAGWELASMAPVRAHHEPSNGYAVDGYTLCVERALS